MRQLLFLIGLRNILWNRYLSEPSCYQGGKFYPLQRDKIRSQVGYVLPCTQGSHTLKQPVVNYPLFCQLCCVLTTETQHSSNRG